MKERAMKERVFDARSLDVFALARAAGRVEGAWPLADLTRLGGDLFGECDGPPAAAGEVRFSAAGRLQQVRAGEPQTWLELQARADVRLVCQRCLGPLAHALEVQRAVRFVRDEQEAERLDEDSEDDVLALPTGRIDLRSLVEDELILALPLVPRHETCPQPLLLSGEAEARGGTPEEPVRRPFDALAQLRRGRS
jgi:uncharacterized protein